MYKAYESVINGLDIYDELIGEFPTEDEAFEAIKADMKATYDEMVRTFGEEEVYFDEGSIEVGRIDFATGKPSDFNKHNWFVGCPEDEDLV